MPHRTEYQPNDLHVDDVPIRDRAVRDDLIADDARHESYRTDDVVVADDAPRANDYGIAGRINMLLVTVLVALEGLLALRFTLVAFGANRSSGFVDFVLNISRPFVRPFDGAFANRTWDSGIIEVSTFLAMGIFALIFGIAAMLLAAVLPRVTGYNRHERVEHRSVTHGGH